jgi:hypothetical protein
MLVTLITPAAIVVVTLVVVVAIGQSGPVPIIRKLRPGVIGGAELRYSHWQANGKPQQHNCRKNENGTPASHFPLLFRLSCRSHLGIKECQGRGYKVGLSEGATRPASESLYSAPYPPPQEVRTAAQQDEYQQPAPTPVVAGTSGLSS